ncbi:MAG: polysaccharide biosynthesis/export family protein [Gammaproteobacteria bacterium]
MFVAALAASAGVLAQSSNYALGPGDVLSIQVYEEADLSFPEMRIGDTGMINYPLLGEVPVAGATTGELEQLLRDKLVEGEFLIAPAVTVTIVEYRPFYINGEVETPGGYPFQPGLTLRKAVSLAGGFTERANRKRFTIHRGGEDPADDDEARTVSSLDAPLAPGDTITINERFF